jgi:hypothetical protein
MIHVAVLHLTEPYKGEEQRILASLDGQHYLGVSRMPAPGDEEAIAQMFEGDGNFKPMTIGTLALRKEWWRGTVDRIEQTTVGT